MLKRLWNWIFGKPAETPKKTEEFLIWEQCGELEPPDRTNWF